MVKTISIKQVDSLFYLLAILVALVITPISSNNFQSAPIGNSALAVSASSKYQFPITITVDGESKIVFTDGVSVADVLKKSQIQISSYDLVVPSLTEIVNENSEIEITKRTKQLYKVESIAEYKTMYYYSPEVKAGTETVKTEGENGIVEETFEQLISCGEIVEEKLLSKKYTKDIVNKEILIGFKAKPISTLDFKWEFNDNGEPEEYLKVLRGNSAGYSASAGASTASGLPAVVGHVAVDPNDIPYGSKLFIQSPDGLFVYGYAIAADTGLALKQNKIEVDLFYGSYKESADNGIKEVDIFVLE